MAINFPASPNLNDTFVSGGVTYTWDGTVWVSSGPAAFVQKSGDTMTGDLTVPSLNSGPLSGFRNQLINGDFRVWQRGTTFPKNGIQFRYSADRWEGNGAFCDFIRDVGFGGITQSIRVHNVTSGFAYIVQHIELLDTDSTFCQFASGSTWTLSYWMKGNTPGAPGVDFRADRNGTNQLSWTPTGAVQAIETSGAWTRYSRTFTAATYVKGQHDRATVYIPAINSNDTTFTGIQLEPGPVATPFEIRPIGTELALCQRYYCQGESFIKAAAPGGGTIGSKVFFPSTMRLTPTAALNLTLGTNGVLAYQAPDGLVVAGTPNSQGDLRGNYTADAEL